MSIFDWGQVSLFICFFIAFTPLLGSYMTFVFADTIPLEPYNVGRIERLCYSIGGIDCNEEMTWTTYLKYLLVFNLIGLIALFSIQLFQGFLPLNPQHFSAVPWALALNTAISFVTNTNWQSYSGETTLSYFTQMLGLSVQNFLSAATGMSVLLTLIRGLVRKTANTIGNFWVDLTRSVVYLLLPLSIILALALVGQGVVQTFAPYAEVHTLENNDQVIPLGPVASQVAIKQLGTNGGGFFNANSSHPFENPTPLSNFLEMMALFLIPAASLYMYGNMIHSKKHGWFLFGVMLFLLGSGLLLALIAQNTHNPVFEAFPVLEGQEVRFGTTNAILWSTTTTATSNGSVNAMLSSLSPLAGGVALLNIMIGSLIFGGVGTGLSNMIMYVLLTVFLSGLMVGRTPEYLGKKIEKYEIKWVMLPILMPTALILIGSGFSLILSEPLKNLGNKGPHGLTEMLYAFASTAGNNGSAFASLNTNNLFFHIVLAFSMLIGRLSTVVPALALAGLLAKKKSTPPSIGTFSTNTGLFFALLIGMIIVIGALSFFPALSLGPLVEHLLMLEGQSF